MSVRPSNILNTAAGPAPEARERLFGLSVVVVTYEMRREIARTLETLQPTYQRGVSANDYEVIVVDNSRRDPLEAEFVQRFGQNFRLIRPDRLEKSPAYALNLGAASAKGDAIASMIDGARMCSPGCIAWTLEAMRLIPNAVVTVPSWHLGPDVQNESVKAGYCQAVEDKLLATRDWQQDGYRLFELCERLDPSCERAVWFQSVSESNFLVLKASTFDRLGGYDERFASPGGGAVNLDFFSRLCEDAGCTIISLFGEGTFHQFHGGVSTNVKTEDHPWDAIASEYYSIRGYEYAVPSYVPIVFGQLTEPARRLLARTPNVFTFEYKPSLVRRLKSIIKVSDVLLAALWRRM